MSYVDASFESSNEYDYIEVPIEDTTVVRG